MAIGNFSHLVTNAQMKKVLADVAHINSKKLGNNYTITSQSHGACTSGPATWYGRAGIHLSFWNGAQPYTSTHKNYNKKKRSATVEDMKASLSKAGFQIVWSGTGQDANTKLASSGILRPGDVATMLSSNSAHAAMWTGEDWRSDFLQGNKPYPYSSVGRGGNETFILWRYQPFQDGGTTQRQEPQQKSQTNNIPKNINWRSEKPETVRKSHIPKSKEYINANALSMINFLQSKGLTLTAALGVAGNLMTESHFNPYAYNSNDNGGPSGGLAQWHDKYTGNRKCYNLTNLKKYAQSVGKDWTDIQTQAEYLWQRISNTKNLVSSLNSADSVERAAYIFGHLYERFDGHNDPNSGGHKSRAQNALTLQSLYSSTYGNNNTQPTISATSEPITNNTAYSKLDLLNAKIDPSVNDELAAIDLNSNFNHNILPFNSNSNLDTLPIIPGQFLTQNNSFEVKDNNNNSYINYYDIMSDFIKRNPLRFQKGGNIDGIFNKVKRKEWPNAQVIDYEKIINAVYNQNDNSFGEVSTGENANSDLPTTFDIYKDSNSDINDEGKLYQDLAEADIDLGDESNTPSTEDKPSSIRTNKSFDDKYKKSEYNIEDIDALFSNDLKNIQKVGDSYDFDNLSVYDKEILKDLVYYLNSRYDRLSGNSNGYVDPDKWFAGIDVNTLGDIIRRYDEYDENKDVQLMQFTYENLDKYPTVKQLKSELERRGYSDLNIFLLIKELFSNSWTLDKLNFIDNLNVNDLKNELYEISEKYYDYTNQNN